MSCISKMINTFRQFRKCKRLNFGNAQDLDDIVMLMFHCTKKSYFPGPGILCSKIPSKYHLSIIGLFKKDRISYLRKVKNKNFSVISRYPLHINFLAQKKDRISNLRKVQNENFLIISKLEDHLSRFLKYNGSFVNTKETSSFYQLPPLKKISFTPRNL